MNWIRITVKTTTEGSDVVADILGEISAGGVIIEDAADILAYNRPKEEWDYIDEHLADGYDPEVCVRGFIGEEEDVAAAEQFVLQELQRIKNNAPDFPWGSLHMEVETVRDENWAENWKKYYKPFKPGKYIVIKPSWEEYVPQKEDLVLEMDPGAAFGTGSHETTRMCILLLEEYVKKGCSVLDVGCGTGVLAMCAALLGAQSVRAVDIDAEAVKVAKANAERGGFAIDVECGNLLEKRYENADIVVANIIADAVMKLAPAAKAHLNEGGIYIVSGIINERADEVEAALAAQGFQKLQRLTQGEWTAMAWRK